MRLAPTPRSRRFWFGVSIALIAVVGASSYVLRAEEGESPSPSPSASESVAPGAASASVAAFESIAAKESSRLRSDFRKALKEQLKQFKRDLDRAAKDGKASRKEQLRAWNDGEKKKRHEFFSKNGHGPERRAFIQDFIQRREALLTALKEEEKAQKRDQDTRLKAYEDSQRHRTGEFEAALKRGERPAAYLWNP